LSGHFVRANRSHWEQQRDQADPDDAEARAAAQEEIDRLDRERQAIEQQIEGAQRSPT
jgi:hypothetical protein